MFATLWNARHKKDSSTSTISLTHFDVCARFEQTAQCVDEIGTAIVELNAERVPRLGEGWGLSIAFGMLGSVGFFIMVLPNLVRRLTGAMGGNAVALGMDALLSTFFGVLPLVLLALPASVTDKCIALETRLSDLLMPDCVLIG